jgi:hypothetical protein
VSELDTSGIYDETVVVPRAVPPVVEEPDDETVVVQRSTPVVAPAVVDEPEDETVVVQRAAPVVLVVDEPDDHTVVVQRGPAPTAVSDADVDDSTVVVDRAATRGHVPEDHIPEDHNPEDHTVVIDRGAPATTETAADDDDSTRVVGRTTDAAPVIAPTVAPVGPGVVENGRTAFVPGDSTGLLKDRYQIRSSVTTTPVAPYRTPFEVAPPRHTSRAIADVNSKTRKANRSRGVVVIIAVVGVTLATALVIGIILIVVFTA